MLHTGRNLERQNMCQFQDELAFLKFNHDVAPLIHKFVTICSSCDSEWKVLT